MGKPGEQIGGFVGHKIAPRLEILAKILDALLL